MLAKCAIPFCVARFRYLHEGQIFHVQVQPSRPVTGRVEYYWLCADCSLTWKVIRRNGRLAIERRPLELPPSSSLPHEGPAPAP